MVQAVAYEACRIFRDRLVGAEAAARFDALLAGTLRSHWRSAATLDGVLFATLGSSVEQRLAGRIVGMLGDSPPAEA